MYVSMLMYVSHSLFDICWTLFLFVAIKGIWKAPTQIKRNEVSLNLLTLLNDDDDAGGVRSPMFADDSPFGHLAGICC